MAVVLMAQYFVKSGKGEEVAETLRQMLPLVKAGEPGCLEYRVHRAVESPDVFFLYEVYRDQAAVEAHRNTAHFQELIEAKVVPLLERRERGLYQLL